MTLSSNTKKIFSSLLLGLSCAPLLSHAFSDLDPDDPYRFMFDHLREIGVVIPQEGNTLQPYRPLTRIQGLAMALKSGHIPITDNLSGETPFSDIDPNSWHLSVVASGLKHKIITAQKSEFRPEAPLTKAEFLAFLFRSTRVDFRGYFSRVRGVADDIDPENWFAPHFAYAKKYQIAHLPADNKYHPLKVLTRKEAGIMSYRQMKVAYGDVHTQNLVELQAQIQRFLTLMRAGKMEQAQFHLHRIMALNDKLIRVRNSADMVATKSISRSMTHLTDSLRYLQYGRTLPAIENLLLSFKQAKKAAHQSESLAPLALELQAIVKDMLDQIHDGEYVVRG